MAARGAKPQARAARGGRLRPADLLKLRPSHYEDETRVTAIADAEPGVPALFEGICEKQVATYRVLEFVLADDTGRLTVTFVRFNPGMRSATAVGKRLRLFGQPQAGGRGGLLRRGPLRLVHPRLRGAEAPLPAHLTARYPKVAGFSEAVIARHVQRELLRLRELGDPLPPPLRRRSGTLPLAESLRLLHRPQPHELPLIEKRALPSLKFDEWLAHIAFKQRQKSRIRHSEAPALAAPAGAIDEFAKRLPFVLTACQRGAMEEIAADLGGSRAMRRLLHGDVGSGKTVVAAFACWLALRAGRQAAIMCPTVILASQHHRRLKPIFAALGFECHLLVSATKATERRALLQRLATQQDCFLVIGTHSLVQDEVEMPLLSLAVIDEQQRFSVAQRKKLESKARVAHVLMMSATPIPITLELGMLAHLDTSRLVEKPQRGAIRTLVFNASRTDEVLREIVRHRLQTYWICPLIKQGAAAGLRAAEDEYERIRALLPGLPAALIHGSMDSARKLAAMNEFETGAIRLLVATTVVEVGIDAPEADAIVINHAERLGLSQLHQLRGRVGRGSSKGFCALLYDPGLAEQAVKRLRVIHAESDGFAIAREDLRLRGPGDLVGKRQSRAFKYVFADLFRDAAAVEAAQKALAGLDAKQLEALQPWLDFWLGNLLA